MTTIFLNFIAGSSHGVSQIWGTSSSRETHRNFTHQLYDWLIPKFCINKATIYNNSCLPKRPCLSLLLPLCLSLFGGVSRGGVSNHQRRQLYLQGVTKTKRYELHRKFAKQSERRKKKKSRPTNEAFRIVINYFSLLFFGQQILPNHMSTNQQRPFFFLTKAVWRLRRLSFFVEKKQGAKTQFPARFYF